MFCTKCGTQNAEGVMYCVSCGAPMEQVAAPAAPAANPGYAPNSGYAAPNPGYAPNPAYGAAPAASGDIMTKVKDFVSQNISIIGRIPFFATLLSMLCLILPWFSQFGEGENIISAAVSFNTWDVKATYAFLSIFSLICVASVITLFHFIIKKKAYTMYLAAVAFVSALLTMIVWNNLYEGLSKILNMGFGFWIFIFVIAIDGIACFLIELNKKQK